MFHMHVLKSLFKPPSRGQLALLQDCRAYSSRTIGDGKAADLDAAREWFRRFNKSTIPEKIGKTEFSRSGGPGGQKVNMHVKRSCTVKYVLTLQKDQFKGNHSMGTTRAISSRTHSSPPRTSTFKVPCVFL
jgi:peptidyl-tRNA hydrolase ICT1